MRSNGLIYYQVVGSWKTGAGMPPSCVSPVLCNRTFYIDGNVVHLHCPIWQPLVICDQYDWGIEFLIYEILVSLNLNLNNSHMWLVGYLFGQWSPSHLFPFWREGQYCQIILIFFLFFFSLFFSNFLREARSLDCYLKSSRFLNSDSKLRF